MRAYALVALALLSACGDDEPEKCGMTVCGDREVCDSTLSPPMCVCSEAYTGEDCAACAYGFRPTTSGDCEPVPIDCDADPLICGDHGMCVVTLMRDVKLHSCECGEGWAGHVCQRCDTGWQDNDHDGTCLPTCIMAMITCEAPHVCSDSDGVARCACPPGYAGDDCTLCARGYHDPGASGTCTATCATAALECGDGQVCDDSAGEPVCACMEGYAGPDCSECAAGWQEGAGPGDCRPTCAVVELDCSGRGACADGDGIPRCACDAGWAGARCEECAPGHRGEACDLCDSGWYREGDGPCVRGCGALSCPSEQHCWEGPDGAACVCNVGYEGAACADCAAGFTLGASGYCVPMPAAAHTLVASGTFRGDQAVVAIDPSAGAIFPLRSMSATQLAFDPTGRRLFAQVSGGIARVDLASGMLFSTISTPSFEAFTYDASRAALVLTGWSGTRRVDPATGTYTTLSTSGVSSAWDAAHDGTRDRIVVTPRSGGTLTLLSAATGASAGTLSTTVPLDYSAGVGVAMTAGGQLFLLGRRSLTENERAAAACRTAARGILGDDYAGAPATVVAAPSPGGTATLPSAMASGPELVIVREYGGSGTLRVTASNPDAVVCIGTYAAMWRIDIAASARFAAVVAESYEPSLSVRIETGHPTPARPSVHVLVRDPVSADPSLTASPEVVRIYSSEAWSSRRIAIYGSSGTSPALLVRVDPVTGAVLRMTELADFVPSGSLAPFVP